jgi:hypothetical protein
MRRFLQENNLVVERVLTVLDFMTANNIDLASKSLENSGWSRHISGEVRMIR